MLAGPRAAHQGTQQGSLQSSMMDKCATNNVWSADGRERREKGGERTMCLGQMCKGGTISMCGLSDLRLRGWGTIDGKRRERRCETGRRDFRRV